MESAGIAFLLLVVVGATGVVGAAGGCSHAHALGVLAADCHALQLRHAPTTLRSDIQALDLTFNRLRALPALGAYSSLELLYLDDNAISVLEEEALQQLPRLRVLSLRLNSITTVPSSLLALLPALRRLDLSENPLVGASLATALAAAPPAAPLEALEVAACGLRALPLPPAATARPLPALRLLNASGNPLRAPVEAAGRLAPLCGLRHLELEGAWRALDSCDCHWLGAAETRGLELAPLLLAHCRRAVAEAPGAECEETLVAAREARERCVAAAAAAADAARREAALRLWGGIGGATAAALLALLLGCFCCARRRRRRREATGGGGEDGGGGQLSSCKGYYEGIPMKTTK